MPTNDFLAFATGGGANVESQVNYAADPLLGTGNMAGVAVAAFNNKALRQANWVASQFAQLIANQTQTNVVDNAVSAQFLAQLDAAILPLPSIYTYLNTGSGTYNLPVVFFIASGNATAAATYTNNGNTFTVSTTISAGTQLTCTGDGAPLTSGTLTKASGTGDATITFYAYRAATKLHVRMAGDGGGGGGSGTSNGTSGGNGTGTTFGAQLSASGGTGATRGGGTAGGTATLGTVANGFTLTGGSGSGGGANSTSANTNQGGVGGTNSLGGAGQGGAFGQSGGAGVTNTGAGGGGGGESSGVTSQEAGGGGGAGGYIDAFILTPPWTHAYAVGAGGIAGVAGTSGKTGGAGASGMIFVDASF
jgi:hypothetical protein